MQKKLMAKGGPNSTTFQGLKLEKIECNIDYILEFKKRFEMILNLQSIVIFLSRTKFFFRSGSGNQAKKLSRRLCRSVYFCTSALNITSLWLLTSLFWVSTCTSVGGSHWNFGGCATAIATNIAKQIKVSFMVRPFFSFLRKLNDNWNFLHWFQHFALNILYCFHCLPIVYVYV